MDQDTDRLYWALVAGTQDDFKARLRGELQKAESEGFTEQLQVSHNITMVGSGTAPLISALIVLGKRVSG